MGILNGKIALVSGAASKRSMGHTIALCLANEGANIILIDKYAKPGSVIPADKDWGGLDDIVSEIKSTGKEAIALVADITSSQQVDSAVTTAINKFNKIDILVHCAAIRGPVGTPVINLAEEDWKKVIDINLNGSFLLAKAVAKNMVAKGEGGKILLIASLGGIKGMPGSAGYCASKYGLIGLTKSLALELAKYKINVNAINPGSVSTNLRDNLHQEMAKAQGINVEEARQKDYEQLTSGIPLGRVATTEEIAKLVLFLVSEQSSYITGEAINITGGVT
jgi:NAD(P)-dependent dehydrogenase (short-subunit alcohol dehydrogenase family)